VAEQVTLDEKIAYLASGRAFPDRPDRVETIETHFAWVFLSPQFVYKLKKPIRFGLIDFREREARHAYSPAPGGCRELGFLAARGYRREGLAT